MARNNGGPAYPTYWIDQDSCGNQKVRDSIPGMTLRDHFAAAALTGLVAHPDSILAINMDDYVHRAYAYADMMLKEREAHDEGK